MDTYTIAEIVVVVIAAVAFCAAMYFSEAFRKSVFAYARKRWRENRTWVFGLIDEELDKFAKDLNVEISKKTDKYIRYEVLKRSIDREINRGSPYSADWVKTEYKAILEQLLAGN